MFRVGSHDGDRLQRLVRIAHGYFLFSLFFVALLAKTRHYAYLGGNGLGSRLENDSESEPNGLLVKWLRGL